MNIAVTNISGERRSPQQTARRLAARLEGIGIDPFLSERERYLVLLGDAPGEIVPLGRPLRGSRLFKPAALRRDVQMLQEFEAFAQEADTHDLLFWGIGLMGAKAEVGSLVDGVHDFNRRLNIEFSELRKHQGFECLLLTIHPRYDTFSGRFDVHAHFICRVPEQHREAARRRLMEAFSKIDLPDNPIRNIGACVTYMLWGIYPPELVESLPDRALADLWTLSKSKARLVRTGGAFAKFRRSIASAPATAFEQAEKARIKANREETADPRPRFKTTDKLLAKIVVTRDGQPAPALLFEERSMEPEAVSAVSAATPSPTYSSATSITTQERPEQEHSRLPKRSAKPAKVFAWHRLWQETINFTKKGFVALRGKIGASTAAMRNWFFRFISGDDNPPE